MHCLGILQVVCCSKSLPFASCRKSPSKACWGAQSVTSLAALGAVSRPQLQGHLGASQGTGQEQLRSSLRPEGSGDAVPSVCALSQHSSAGPGGLQQQIQRHLCRGWTQAMGFLAGKVGREPWQMLLLSERFAHQSSNLGHSPVELLLFNLLTVSVTTTIWGSKLQHYMLKKSPSLCLFWTCHLARLQQNIFLNIVLCYNKCK